MPKNESKILNEFFMKDLTKLIEKYNKMKEVKIKKIDALVAKVNKLKCREYYGGLDLSSSNDITTFVLIFPLVLEEDKYYVLPYFWIPEANLKLIVKRDHVPYDI